MTTVVRGFAVSFSLLALSGGVSGQGQPFSAHAKLTDLPARWQPLMDLFDVPGAAVAAIDGDAVYVATFGVRDVVGRPVTPQTMFYIASVTKTFTASAVCALADDGKLALDDPVTKTLPKLRLADGSQDDITLRDLLCHRPGLDCSAAVALDAYTGEITDERYFHWLARATPAGKVGYSNVHFTLLGRVIEAVMGMDWRDFLTQRLLRPAGMDRTTGYASVLYGDDDAAEPLRRDGDGWRLVAQRKTDRTMHAAGGLGLSVLDGARWLQLWLHDGAVGDRQLLEKDTARAMRETRARFDEPEGSIRIMEGFGLGWQVGIYAGAHRLCSHGGGYDGAGSWLAMLPDEGVGIVVLVNAGGAARGWADIVAIDLLERLTGTPPPWSPYERFPPMARKQKAERSPDDSPPQALPTSALSRPVGLYTGAFRNAEFGTLIVTEDPDGLRFRLGDAPLSAVAGDEKDTLTLGWLFDPPASARWVVGRGGEIDEIVLTDDELGELRFVR